MDGHEDVRADVFWDDANQGAASLVERWVSSTGLQVLSHVVPGLLALQLLSMQAPAVGSSL